MNRYLSLGIISCLFFFLIGCATDQKPSSQDLTKENWRYQVENHSKKWTQGADSWFLTGDANATELASRATTSDRAAISFMNVRVSDAIKNIHTNGGFQLQIFGTDEQASVQLYGPNEGVRNIAVDVRGSTLYLRQMQPISQRVMHRVIVRIGLKTLHRLTQSGCGSVEVIRLQTNDLCIETTPGASGNLYLAGDIGVRRIIQRGQGSINVFGANTPHLDIATEGSGAVNVEGRVGINNITHHGASDISIIGAVASDVLQINADGQGKISIKGQVNLKEVRAKGNTCVYIDAISSQSSYVCTDDAARVGLSGVTRDLYVDTYGTSRFEGASLCAQNAYVRAHEASHINVTASGKVNASAVDSSRIYFYGPKTLLTSFVSGDAVVIPFEERNWCNYHSEYRPYAYTEAYRGEIIYYPTKMRMRHRHYKGE